MARYAAFATMVAALRQKAGYAQQVDLAKRLGIAQQSVSRWENGTSRPRASNMPRLANALGTDDVDGLLKAAGYMPAPADGYVSAALMPFPVEALSADAFERFSHHILTCLYRSATVHRFGGQGHTQDGIDLEVRMPDGRYTTFQCKRHLEFGPTKVRAAVAADTYGADQKILLLSRVATPAARKEIATHPGWDIWDKDDISLKIRQHLTPDEQRRLVDTFFPGQRLALTGQSEAGPWQTVGEFFAPFTDRAAIFNHAWRLVGRQQLVVTALEKLNLPQNRVVCLVGAGGSGKTRVLLELLRTVEAQSPDTLVRLLSPNEEPDSKSLDDLGRGKRLLVVDDAHDQKGLPLLFQRAASDTDLKLVLSLRGYGMTKVQVDASAFALSTHQVAVVDVAPLIVAQATCLAAEVLSDHDLPANIAGDIARLTYDCPLATVISAYLVATNRVPAALVANEAEFRSRIFARFQDVIAGELGRPADGALIRKMLKLIALLQPISVDDNSFAHLAQQVEDIPPTETQRVINLLATGGVLFKRGSHLRLSPDLLADFIIQDVCVGFEGRSTGYAEQVFACATPGQIQNLLVNVSKLDWRLSSDDTTSSRLLDGVWGRIEGRVSGAASQIDAISAAAFYQPARSLDYAEQLIRGGQAPHELSRMLRNVAYNLEYLRRACECLWEIGKDDDRGLRQNPSHAVRILAELCEVGPRKPLQCNEIVVEFGLSLLPQRSSWTSAYTPLDFLVGILATEGHTTTTKGASLVFEPFFARPEAVYALREKVIDSGIALLTHDDISIAVKAAKLIESALRYPMGLFGASASDEARDQWSTEFAETLTKLKALADSGTLSDIVHIEIAKDVAWLAHYGPEELRGLAQAIISTLSESLDARLTLALMSGWMQINLSDNLAGSEQSRQQKLDALTKELLTKSSAPHELLALLDRKLNAIACAGLSTETSPYPLFRLLLSRSNDFAFAIVEQASVQPDAPTVRFASDALAELLRACHDRAFALVELLWQSDVPALQNAVASAYSMYSPQAGFTAPELQLVRSILSTAAPVTAIRALDAITTIASSDRRMAIEVFKSLPLDTSREVGEEAFPLMRPDGPLPLTSLSDADVTEILDKLVLIPDLDGYWVQAFLAELSAIRSAPVLDFFLARLQHLAKHGELYYRVHMRSYPATALRLWEAPDAETSVTRLLVWMKDNVGDAPVRREAGELFVSLCGPLNDAVIAMLSEQLLLPSPDSLRVFIAIVAHADNRFVFAHRSLVTSLLDLAGTLGPELADEAVSALYRSAVNGVWSAVPGQPSSKDLYIRQEAEKALAELPRFSIAYRLYDGLRRRADQSIAMAHAMRGEFADDGEEWENLDSPLKRAQ